MADQKAAAAGTVRFVGGKPYGTEFLHSHTLTRADLKRLGDEGATKEVVFNRDNEFTVNAADLHPAVVERLGKLDDFKVEQG